MPNEIRCRVNRQWLQPENQKYAATRIRDIVVGSDAHGDPFLREDGRWQLDENNNWFLDFGRNDKGERLANDQIGVNSRFGKLPEFWTSLAMVIETLMR